MSGIAIDAGTFAAIIREQKGLPITDAEAEAIAGALETCYDDEEFLATTLSAVRLLADRLEQSPDDGLLHARLPRRLPPQPVAVATQL